MANLKKNARFLCGRNFDNFLSFPFFPDSRIISIFFFQGNIIDIKKKLTIEYYTHQFSNSFCNKKKLLHYCSTTIIIQNLLHIFPLSILSLVFWNRETFRWLILLLFQEKKRSKYVPKYVCCVCETGSKWWPSSSSLSSISKRKYRYSLCVCVKINDQRRMEEKHSKCLFRMAPTNNHFIYNRIIFFIFIEIIFFLIL